MKFMGKKKEIGKYIKIKRKFIQRVFMRKLFAEQIQTRKQQN